MSSDNVVNRRKFLRSSIAGALGVKTLGWTELEEGAHEPSVQTPRIKGYRTLGRTGFKVSDIAAGTGLSASDPSILDALLEAGVNYIDTGESYGNGRAERSVGEVIKKRDRKSLFITTKLRVAKDEKKASIVARTRKCLERLQTDTVDCVMIHGAPDVETLKTPGFHEAMDELKREGRVRFLGACNHGTKWADTIEPAMDKILLAAAEDGRFDVMLLVYNYIAREMGERVLQACSERQIGTTLMKTNPVGRYMELTSQIEALESEGREVPAWLPQTAGRYKENSDKAESFIEQHNLRSLDEVRDAALRFALSNEKVHTVCLTFMNFDYVDAYLKLSGRRFSAADGRMLSAFTKDCGTFYCRHACGLCEPSCPAGVPVNTVMRYNHYFEAQGSEKYAMTSYAALSTSNAGRCGDCQGHCEVACPYGVPIQSKLVLAHRRLSLSG